MVSLMMKVVPAAAVLSLLALSPAVAQFPNDPGAGAPPATPGNAQPGGMQEPGAIEFDSVDRQAEPFEGEIQDPHGTYGEGAYAMALGASSKAFGYVFEFGAFDVQGQTAHGLFAMRGGQFPNPSGVKLYSGTLTYYGKYRDPRTGITGYLYQTEVGPDIDEKRWFLFGDRTVGRDTQSDGFRNIVYYDSQGRPRYYAQSRFYSK